MLLSELKGQDVIAEASELTKSKSNVMAASVSGASDFNTQHV